MGHCLSGTRGNVPPGPCPGAVGRPSSVAAGGLHLLRDPGDLTRIRGVEDVSYQGTTLHAHVDSEGLGELIRVLGDTGVRSLVSQPPTLEELFMRHYGADGQRELSDQGARS